MARFVGTATQGSADAYVEAEIQTALQGQTRNAFKVVSIQFEWINPNPAPAAAFVFEVALSRRTKTAMPNLSDNDVIVKWAGHNVVATSGGSQLESIFTFIPVGDLLIVEDPLYFQVDSALTADANTFVMGVEYELVQISEIDRLTLLTQSLV